MSLHEQVDKICGKCGRSSRLSPSGIPCDSCDKQEEEECCEKCSPETACVNNYECSCHLAPKEEECKHRLEPAPVNSEYCLDCGILFGSKEKKEMLYCFDCGKEHELRDCTKPAEKEEMCLCKLTNDGVKQKWEFHTPKECGNYSPRPLTKKEEQQMTQKEYDAVGDAMGSSGKEPVSEKKSCSECGATEGGHVGKHEPPTKKEERVKNLKKKWFGQKKEHNHPNSETTSSTNCPACMDEALPKVDCQCLEGVLLTVKTHLEKHI